MPTATLIKTSHDWPMTPKKRYRFLIEWAATDATHHLLVEIRWFDSTGASIDTWTLLDAAADVANVWQVNNTHIVPPEDARYARIRISKTGATVKFAIQRIELREHDSSLEKAMREIKIIDDFCSPSIGDLNWARYVQSGSLVISKINATGARGNWSEFGIARLTTGIVSGYGGVIHLEQLGYGTPPIGAEMRAKVRMQNTTNFEAWFGLWTDITTYPDLAGSNVISGIGFRAEAGGGGINWHGVVRDTTGELTANMGVAADTTWRDLGWYRTPAGIQFTLSGEAVGTVKTTNLPSNSVQLAPTFGLLTQSAAIKEMDIDKFALQLYLDI